MADVARTAGLAGELGEAYLAIAGLLGVVDRVLTLRIGRTRHLRTCRAGQWVDGYSGGAGAPCSRPCVEAGGAYLLGLAALGLVRLEEADGDQA